MRIMLAQSPLKSPWGDLGLGPVSQSNLPRRVVVKTTWRWADDVHGLKPSRTSCFVLAYAFT